MELKGTGATYQFPSRRARTRFLSLIRPWRPMLHHLARPLDVRRSACRPASASLTDPWLGNPNCPPAFAEARVAQADRSDPRVARPRSTTRRDIVVASRATARRSSASYELGLYLTDKGPARTSGTWASAARRKSPGFDHDDTQAVHSGSIDDGDRSYARQARPDSSLRAAGHADDLLRRATPASSAT